ncbi:unnamed protein product [Cochlearia groenlandica]
MTSTFFDEITEINRNASLLGTWSIFLKKGFKLTSDKHVKFPNWWHKYFFVKVNSASALDVDKVYRTKWYPVPQSQSDIDDMVKIDDLPSLFDGEENVASPEASSPARARVRTEGPAIEAGDRTEVQVGIGAEIQVVPKEARVDENGVAGDGQVTNDGERAAADLTTRELAKLAYINFMNG